MLNPQVGVETAILQAPMGCVDIGGAVPYVWGSLRGR